MRLILVAALFAGVAYTSHRQGVPETLPGAALGWILLFPVERAAALLGVVGGVLLVGWKAIHGELPVKFGQIEYPARVVSEAHVTAENQEHRLRGLESVVLGVPSARR